MFEKGHKLAKGGRREGAGRKSKAQLEAELIERETFESIIRRNEIKLANHTVSRAYESDTVLNKLIDKFLPEIDGQTNQKPIAIFINVEGQNPRVDSQRDSRTILIGSVNRNRSEDE
jgi:hypothetical protein